MTLTLKKLFSEQQKENSIQVFQMGAQAFVPSTAASLDSLAGSWIVCTQQLALRYEMRASQVAAQRAAPQHLPQSYF